MAPNEMQKRLNTIPSPARHDAIRSNISAALVRWEHRHNIPLLILCTLCLLYWSKVLFTGQVLLPGDMLRGFAPFGSDPQAPWNILQWDALGQYYPWRLFTARQLQSGLIPLWNPHQFAGTPFLANGQSAVFYPLNLPFWIMDVAYAFGVSALLHAFLATLSTYFLAQYWQLSRSASLLAAIAFGFCGYLASWIMLPTLSNTASWLPLLLLCLEWGARKPVASDNRRPFLVATLPLSITLCCALLAGHAQIFFYLLVALLLRALLLTNRVKAAGILLTAGILCLILGALQMLPTLELARLGHRAAQGSPTAAGWQIVASHALQYGEWLALFIPGWPSLWGSVNENFPYVGLAVGSLSLIGTIGYIWNRFAHKKTATSSQDAVIENNPQVAMTGYLFGILLGIFGLLYALATPLSQFFFFTIPGIAQMGGPGRALLLWGFGAAITAAYGLDFLRRLWKSDLLPLLALILLTGELFVSGWTLHPTASRNTIYPQTKLTRWLQANTQKHNRILFITQRERWRPIEIWEGAESDRTHPGGVTPPNGAMVYGLNDVNGYDSLAPRAYRKFVAEAEGKDVSPAWNGNMILLNNPNSPALDALRVSHIVSNIPLDIKGNLVLQVDGCYVYQHSVKSVASVSGSDFYPGWRKGQYQPESFRFGSFLTLCTLAFMGLLLTSYKLSQRDTKDAS